MTSPTALQAITRHEAGALAAAQAKLSAYAGPRMEQAAQIRTRRAVCQAQADKMHAALERWIETVYGHAGEDLRYHVHAMTHAIQIPAPWSRTQHRAYHLSEPEGRLLSCLVQDLIACLPARRRLFEYDASNRRWILNVTNFPTLPAALEWLRGPCAITGPAVLEGWVKYPSGRRLGQPAGQPVRQPAGR